MTARAPVPPDPGSVASELERQLREFLPHDSLMSSLAPCIVDGVRPSLGVAAASAEDVARILKTADETGAALIARGGGSHIGLGMPPLRYDLALAMTSLDRILDYEPADLTVTVEAGVNLAELQARLAEHGQWLPLDPPCGPTATIGGVVAANASGPARIAFGTARDLVIGMTVATADGQLVRSGGRVVKNVAGYDMAKMHIGALGTLGLITQLSFKVAPLPEATRTLTVPGSDTQDLVLLSFRVRDAGLPATGIGIYQPTAAAEAQLLLRFAGGASVVDRSCLDASKLASALGLHAEQAPETVWEETGAVLRPDSGAILRVSHLPGRAGATLRDLEALNADLLSYPTAGVTSARLLALAQSSYEAVLNVRATAEAAGGALVIESAPAEAKRALGVWGTQRGDFALMQRLKAQMDPNSTLSPGRFLGGL